MIAIVDPDKPSPDTVTTTAVPGTGDRVFYLSDDALWECVDGAWQQIAPEQHPWWKRAWMRLRLPGSMS